VHPAVAQLSCGSVDEQASRVARLERVLSDGGVRELVVELL
jgi:hypothetical protein